MTVQKQSRESQVAQTGGVQGAGPAQGTDPDGARTPASTSGPIGRILIVEDESNILEALSFILGRAGWDVRGHGKGEDALQEIARLSPDILVLDVMLPGRSGFDILADLRARPETQALPVLMLTAKGQAKDREQAMALGANGFLTKPFSNTELLEVIAAMGGQSSAASPDNGPDGAG
ncbi:response regulator [Rhodobacteraceae bacterium N5(2021)]|uniref:Response regulator n=1 Tax=Gymnodinialimonas phycosphaerae TaxID=2841589 RepID=A0A975YH98_9RHOB|nr:response regulator [Gymnodinialimonas phycosphaerae]